MQISNRIIIAASQVNCLFTEQVIVNKGTWPSRTSIAVFLFKTADGAKRWVEDFSTNCRATGFDFIDALMGATKDVYQNGKLNLFKVYGYS